MLRAVTRTDAVLLDPTDAYPELRDVRARLAAGDWESVRRMLDEVSPVGRTMLIRYAGTVAESADDGVERLLREVLERDPTDAAAAAMLGTRLTDVGWRIRTQARAQDVSAEQFRQFREWLCAAEAVLIDGTARNPDDPALWTVRLPSARGLEVGLAEVRRRFDRVVPNHLPAQRQMLQQLCPKWSGSWELLHPWCHAQMLATPPGAPQGMLVAEGHIEHCFELPQGTRTDYLTSDSVRDELYEAANRSILHPEFGREFGWVQAVSTFAMVFSLIGDHRSAAAAFALLGELATEYPWDILGDPAEKVRHFRHEAQVGVR